MLKIIFGRARTGKTYTLTNCLTESLRSGKNDVVLIVPEQYSFQSERDILEEIEHEYISRVKAVSFTRLLDEVGRECGGLAGKRISSGIRTIMVCRAIEAVEHDLVAFAKQAGSINFASSLSKTIVEFKQAGISDEKLMEISGLMEDCRLKWKLHDISIIMAAYDGLISKVFIDPADDMNRLKDMLLREKWFAGKDIFMDCFKGFTRGEIAVIEQIISTAANVTVTIPCDSVEDNEDGAGLFSNIKKTAAELLDIAQRHGVEVCEIKLEDSRYDRPELNILEKNLFSSEKEIYDKPTDAVGVCCADYPSDELFFVARKIKQLVREEGYRFRDFVVISRNMDSYENIVNGAMDSYGVPCHIDSRVSAKNQAVMVFALSAIEAAFTYNTESILRWLKTGLAGYSDKQIALIENYTYTWNIKGKTWQEEWTRSPYGLEKRQPKDSFEKLADLENMRKAIVETLSSFADSFRFGATGMSKALYRLAVTCKLPENLSALYDKLNKTDKNAAEVLRQSYSVFMEVLSDIAECYKDSDISRDTYVSAFKAALAEYEIGTIPMGIDQVVFGSADHIRTGRPKVAFVLGVNQDVFPASPKSEGLISVRERKTMIDLQLPVSDRLIDAAVDEKYMFYSAACCASQRVYFSFCQADLASEKLEPSVYLERVKGIFPQAEFFVEREKCRRDLNYIESLSSAKKSFAESFNDNSEFSASIKKYFSDYAADELDGYKIEDGANLSLSPDIARKLYGKDIRLSATKVDRFFGCPFSYFCKFGVNAKKLDRAEMNVLQRGSMVHHILENALKEFGKELANIDDAEISLAIDRYTEEYVNDISADQLNDYRWKTMVKQVKELTLVLCREMGAQLADTDFEPVGFEVTLEAEGDIQPVELDIGDGGKVILGGQVDRIDGWANANNKYVCVVDYKTGRKKFQLSDLLYGLNMQMLLYLYSAVNGQKGKYAGHIPAGILYIPSERTVNDSDNKTEAYSGILLNDGDVLTALDNSHSGRYIPVKYKKNGEIGATSQQLVLDREEFELLFGNAEKKLIQMGRELHSGNIAVLPTDGADSNANVCKYCDYRTVCRREKSQENSKVEKLKKEEIMEKLRGESNGNA